MRMMRRDRLPRWPWWRAPTRGGDCSMRVGSFAISSRQEVMARGRHGIAQRALRDAGRGDKGRASCVVKLLVAGMAFSTPARVGRKTVASRAMLEVEDVGDGGGRGGAEARASRSAPRVSAVSPDCERTSTAGSCRVYLERVAVFAGVLDVDREAGEVFEDDLAGEARRGGWSRLRR